MALKEFNISQAFLDTFKVALPFPELIARRVLQATQQEEFQRPREQMSTAELGKITLSDFTLFDPETQTSLVFDPPPVITVSGSKTVVKTPIAGKDFSIKEIISCDDFKITIRGFMFQDLVYSYSKGGFLFKIGSKLYPEEKMQMLLNFYRANRALETQSDYLRMFGIDQMVIESIDFPAVDGLQGVFGYEIQGASDAYVELFIQDQDPTQAL